MSARFAPVIKSRVAMSTAPRFVAFRSISSTANYQKGPIGVAKDTLKKADDLASNVALKGLNKGGMWNKAAVYSVGLVGNANESFHHRESSR